MVKRPVATKELHFLLVATADAEELRIDSLTQATVATKTCQIP
jgi:hypothetical protein